MNYYYFKDCERYKNKWLLIFLQCFFFESNSLEKDIINEEYKLYLFAHCSEIWHLINPNDPMLYQDVEWALERIKQSGIIGDIPIRKATFFERLSTKIKFRLLPLGA